MGAAMLVGGLKRERQTFDAEAASTQSMMLLLACVALIMPAIFELVDRRRAARADRARRRTSRPTWRRCRSRVAIVLLVSYVAGLFFSLKTHRDLFNPDRTTDDDARREPWSVRRSVTRAGARRRRGRRDVGDPRRLDRGGLRAASGCRRSSSSLIVVAIVGNAAEHWVAVYFASRDKMDLSVNIAIGSSAQIALFVAPVLVLLSFFVGPFPMALVFNGLELGAIVLAVLIANHVTQEGESTWFEGVQLLAVYVVLGIVFFFV